MILAALLLAGSSVTGLQPARPAPRPVVITRQADNEQMWLLGFAAYGADADLGRLETAANAISAPNERIPDDPEGRLQVMVLFVSNSREEAMRLYRGTIAGRYGRLEVEAVVISVADARDGIDTEREVRAVDPATLREE